MLSGRGGLHLHTAADVFSTVFDRRFACWQEPMLALLRKHIDSKGKQAKLKSPQELQELLDVTRQLVLAPRFPRSRVRNQCDTSQVGPML